MLSPIVSFFKPTGTFAFSEGIGTSTEAGISTFLALKSSGKQFYDLSIQ
jgi:hypothetical protein